MAVSLATASASGALQSAPPGSLGPLSATASPQPAGPFSQHHRVLSVPSAPPLPLSRRGPSVSTTGFSRSPQRHRFPSAGGALQSAPPRSLGPLSATASPRWVQTSATPPSEPLRESGDTAGCMSNSMERRLMKAMGLCGNSS
ncbi:misshapen-like kinase 1 [Parus major]|uniref:misshapen-like kinase 1 n=1 Tax=Parus major TaxID=9157 RepID=UPI001443FA77|nr:misshapen-like kinase 1 [Parus major]